MRGVQWHRRCRGCMGCVLLQSAAPVGHVLCGCEGGQLWRVWREQCVRVGTAKLVFVMYAASSKPALAPHRTVSQCVFPHSKFPTCLLCTGRATVTITLNATRVTSGQVVIDLGAAAGSTLPPATMVVGVHAIAAALGVDEGSVRGLVAGPDHQSVTFLLAQSAAVSSSGGQSGTFNGSKLLSDADIMGGLVASLRPSALLVTVQRSAGSLWLLRVRRGCLVPLPVPAVHCFTALAPVAEVTRVVSGSTDFVLHVCVRLLSRWNAWHPECGNGVCELGEVCSSAMSCNSTSLCPVDCPASAGICPMSRSLVGTPPPPLPEDVSIVASPCMNMIVPPPLLTCMLGDTTRRRLSMTCCPHPRRSLIRHRDGARGAGVWRPRALPRSTSSLLRVQRRVQWGRLWRLSQWVRPRG